jgi:nucleoside-diphosphate-sugar epimerase
MKVLVTGHRGYIGVHLVRLLKEAGHRVTGVDLDLFHGCAWQEQVPPDRDIVKDVRAIELKDLEGHDAVCHLAAISNDPMGDLDPRLTQSINRDASVRLARLAKEAGVSRFLFSGSCSVYGAGGKLDLEESDPLNPLTAYARSKIETEAALWPMADESFSPVSLRNATAYGASPMLRVDLVVNNLLASALAYGEIRIMSDGTPWRPLIHCADIARAFIAFAEAPRQAVHAQAFNVGANQENYQVKDVADFVARLVPGAHITFTGELGEDPRNYRVRFDKLNAHLPEFRLSYDLWRGMAELHADMVRHGFDRADFEGVRFVRLRTLKDRVHLIAAPAIA